MKKAVSAIMAVIISLVFPFACISASLEPIAGKYLGGYFGPHPFKFTVLRYIVFAVIIFALTYLNRKNIKVFTIYLPIGYCAVITFAYYDYFIGKHFIYNFSYGLWLCTTISVACFALFISATLFIKKDYKKFYKAFWRLYLLTYILILLISFIRPRDSYGLSVNTHPGGGTIQYFSYIFRHPDDAYMVLICLGNILIFVPYAFIMKSLSDKIPDWVILITGALLPFCAEGYQYLFRCGNVDVDDIILNISGVIAGFILMKLIYRYKLKAAE